MAQNYEVQHACGITTINEIISLGNELLLESIISGFKNRVTGTPF